MRFVYGLFVFVAWVILFGCVLTGGMNIANDVQILSLAIVVAGAMAGGD